MALLLYVFVVATEALTFLKFCLVPEVLLRCRVVVVAKLKNCRVPSSADFNTLALYFCATTTYRER